MRIVATSLIDGKKDVHSWDHCTLAHVAYWNGHLTKGEVEEILTEGGEVHTTLSRWTAEHVG